MLIALYCCSAPAIYEHELFPALCWAFEGLTVATAAVKINNSIHILHAGAALVLNRPGCGPSIAGRLATVAHRGCRARVCEFFIGH